MNVTENSRGFASDNNAGVHPDILKAMATVNDGHVIAYGDDPYTEKATSQIKQLLGDARIGRDVFQLTRNLIDAVKVRADANVLDTGYSDHVFNVIHDIVDISQVNRVLSFPRFHLFID